MKSRLQFSPSYTVKFFGQTGIREFLWIHACTVPVKRLNLIPVILNSVKTILGSKGYAGSQSPDYCNLKLAYGFLIHTMVNGWGLRSIIDTIYFTNSVHMMSSGMIKIRFNFTKPSVCMYVYRKLHFTDIRFTGIQFRYNSGTISVNSCLSKKMYRGFAYKPFSYLNFFTRMTKCCIYRNPMHPIEFPLNPSHM